LWGFVDFHVARHCDRVSGHRKGALAADRGSERRRAMTAFRFTAGATMKRDPSKDSAFDPDPHLLTRRLRLAIAGLQLRERPGRQIVLIVAKGVEVGDRRPIAEDRNNESEQEARRRLPPPMRSVC
jgi:hypothetical protein